MLYIQKKICTGEFCDVARVLLSLFAFRSRLWFQRNNIKSIFIPFLFRLLQILETQFTACVNLLKASKYSREDKKLGVM